MLQPFNRLGGGALTSLLAHAGKCWARESPFASSPQVAIQPTLTTASWSKASCSSSDSFSSVLLSPFTALVLRATCFRTRGSREHRHSSNQYECEFPSPCALSQPLVKVARCTSLSIASAARYGPGGLIAEPTNRRRTGTVTFRPLGIGRESGGCAHSCTEKQSVLSFRVPDSSRGRTYRTASYLVETRVNKPESGVKNSHFRP
jgi:hypothetical protein